MSITPDTPVVSVHWLHRHLDDPSVLVVDASTHLSGPAPESGRGTFDAEHIPGAVFADLLTDFADPDAPHPWTVPSSERFAAAAGALGIGDGIRVVIYDQHDGYWATRFWWQLRLEGFTEGGAILDGGLPAWRTAGLPVTDRPTEVRPTTFTSHPRPELYRSTEQILESLGDARTVLVSVVDTDTYRGAGDNPRSGHIPGAINIPVATFVTPPRPGSSSRLRTCVRCSTPRVCSIRT